MGVKYDFEDFSDERKAELDKAINKGLLSAGLIVEAEIKTQAPVDTGALRNSIDSKLTSDDDGRAVVIGTNQKYAPYVEFGTGQFAELGNGRKTPWTYKSGNKYYHTKGSKPNKFMRGGFRKSKDKALNILKRVMSEVLK